MKFIDIADKIKFCAAEYRKQLSGKSELISTAKTAHDAFDWHRCCMRNVRRKRSIVYPIRNHFWLRWRWFLPHKWFQYYRITNGNQTSITKVVRLPGSITEWSIYGLSQCCATGFCVSEPIEITVFKPHYVKCHLPYSLKRQEQVSVACSVSNYNYYPLNACFSIHDYSTNSLCTSSGIGNKFTPVCSYIPKSDTMTILIPLVPLEVGTAELAVKMLTVSAGDILIQNVRVVPEGVTRSYSYAAELDPQGLNMNVSGGCSLRQRPDLRLGKCFKSVSREGSCVDLIKDNITREDCCIGRSASFSVAFHSGSNCELCPSKQEIHFCEEKCACANTKQNRTQVNYFYVRAPENFVADSEKAWLGVTGKYYSIEEHTESKFQHIQGIEDILKLPGSHGEANMKLFGPNCATVSFMASTNPGSEIPYLSRLKQSYQYQLRYRKKDSGGFAIWQHSEASTWLSSFVLRTMCCARKFIQVDPNVVSGLINFLGTRQNASGKILEPRTVFSREMLGGVQEDGVSITAYTIMSLLECCSPKERPMLVLKVCPAVTYMLNEVRANRVQRPYAQAVVYLALLKACNYSDCGICKRERVCDFAVVQKLRRELFKKSKIGEDGSRHWEADTSVGKAYWYKRQPSAISVEMTSYVLEACLDVSDCQCAASVGKWLNSVRNSQGTFISTQVIQSLHISMNLLCQFVTMTI
ncbi:alpha-1-macroglobulin-like [Corticium candelabrum]|uniref:alpha-1-macroglobulin-like n=1 Tax=Corticium candelabrum TaxID=121492 RepID=UPI002E26F31E|nr:alpha-1-macroglobulin-like [Corticium candelabrum]